MIKINSNIQSITLMSLLISNSFFLAGCDQKQTGKIQWQIPLESPEDPHSAAQTVVTIPDWAVAYQGQAEFILLQKNTSHTFSMTLALGGRSQIQHWDIKLLGFATGLRVQNNTFLNDKNVHNPAALVDIRHHGERIYHGWLYKKFPELFGIDNPQWKVWLKGITLRPLSETHNIRLP